LEHQKNKTITDKIWDFLSSVKLAIVIFALISLTSIIGTILEQKGDPETNLEILTRLFGKSLAPTLFTVSEKLGFMDMYHSWWFTGLLVLFSVNLVICSLDRLPRIWKLVREPIGPLPEENLRKFVISREITIKGRPDTVKDTVASALRKARFHAGEVQEEKDWMFYAQRGKYSRLGVFITHFSILIILIGAMIGIRFGFKGYLNLPEGAVSNVALSATDREVPFGFEIRCDNFDVDFYGRSDMPKEYRSWLTVIKNGREILRKSIAVNDPLTYEGITFYQSSYGIVPGSLGQGIFVFNTISRDGKSATVNPRLGDSFQVSGTALTAKIIDFSPALRIDEHGHATTYANQMSNPAVFIEFSEGGKNPFSGWILKRHPETWQLPDGSRVEFIDYWGVEFTGLQVRKDPGVWVVYFGCISMSLGLFIALFMSHRKIWVKLVEEEKNNIRVIIGATSNKNRAAFERKIDKMISVLSKKREGEK
jgi:cytochrome c biogenesis protein